MKKQKKYGPDLRSMFLQSAKESFLMLVPKVQIRNPVMFVTYIAAIITTYYVIAGKSLSFNVQIAIWLWFTVLFANFASSLAESKGKAHAHSLRKTKEEIKAKKLINGTEVLISATQLQKGDIVVCNAKDVIPADGEVIEGVALVDESAITGESAPVIRESGGDRSAVTAGTQIVSDRIVIQVTSEKGESFLDKIILLIEGAKRQKTPNEIALNIVLSTLTIIFLLIVVTIKSYADYSSMGHSFALKELTVPVLLSLLVCLIPTTISALLSAIGIAGMDRLIQRNVIAKSGRAVEAAGDVDLLIIDKTGTITLGNRMATKFIPVEGVLEKDLAAIAQLSSIADETPEGRSIVVLAKNKFELRADLWDSAKIKIFPFSSRTCMSGVDILDGSEKVERSIRKGSIEAITKHIERLGGTFPKNLLVELEAISQLGRTPLCVSDNDRVIGGICLKDIVKGGIKERFSEMRKMGIKTLMVTGDNALTAASIAAEAGVDDFIANATPEIKLARIRQEQKEGKLVAMTGDGTNDAPALAQADVGVTMNTGTQASREAGNMVDLDSNPTKLMDIVIIGKQLLMTRGALTTFSIANDVAKYFAIIPAIFGSMYAQDGVHGPLSALNIMRLHSTESSILSAVIFNALIIVLLIPLALKGIKYKPQSAAQVLRRNILLYGAGGVIAPFIGIKIIDLILVFFRCV